MRRLRIAFVRHDKTQRDRRPRADICVGIEGGKRSGWRREFGCKYSSLHFIFVRFIFLLQSASFLLYSDPIIFDLFSAKLPAFAFPAASPSTPSTPPPASAHLGSASSCLPFAQLGLDSLDLVELLVAVEREFKVSWSKTAHRILKEMCSRSLDKEDSAGLRRTQRTEMRDNKKRQTQQVQQQHIFHHTYLTLVSVLCFVPPLPFSFLLFLFLFLFCSFQIELTDDEYNSVKSVDDIVACIHNHPRAI